MRVLIVEDQVLIARRIERFVREILGDKLTYLNAIDNVDDAEEWLFESSLDLLLLDLDFHGQSGFDLLKTAVSGAFHTIIISAHKDQAYRAFEYGVIDFVGKPFDLARLEQAFDQLERRKLQAGTQYLSIRRAGQLEIIALEDVLYAQGAGAYSELKLEDGCSQMHDKSLDKLLHILPSKFIRIHKSYLVDIERVTKLVRKSGSYYELQLTNEERLPIGRTRYKEVKQQLEQRLMDSPHSHD
jgi:two-component system response regulator LytT